MPETTTSLTTLTARAARPEDLDAINRLVAEAIEDWPLPERVRRLALPAYRYTEADRMFLDMVVLECAGDVVGVAAWEAAGAQELPEGIPDGLLLHGLYVGRAARGQGVGRQLVEASRAAAREAGVAGVLVKAQASAAGFFAAMGFVPVPVRDRDRDYEQRYWWPAKGASSPP
ncbi:MULTISPECIES: GNAT family N-acetyltransferase [unclassified Thioalkalivibrio]|uniref:GNAT family N-acetyltransferase n=1 Tax=unclassified Thioalkalivibrio TaxID=2621013 RepID=UPI00037C6186|nr:MULTISPECIES: GNAT family N-acetyltransferase [unclassified Thioalkalivibrio]